MKTLYMVRHAKSSWKYPSLTDFERPLNRRGRKNARLMGTVLQAKRVKPDLILSSPANRAAMTARLIAAALRYPLDQIQYRERVYQFEEKALLAVLQHIDDSNHAVMIVGHNPAVSELAGYLADPSSPLFPTAAVCCLKLNVASWADVAAGCGNVAFFEVPKKQAP